MRLELDRDTWQPIACAPLDGSLILLFDPALIRSARMPQDRRVHNRRVVVGRWHVPDKKPQQSDWVTDIRSIAYQNEQAYWDADPVEPTHWSPLPAPPPTDGWIDVDTLPLAFEYVLLFVPNLSQSREYPMNAGKRAISAFDMVIGCCIDDGLQKSPSWLTDICEAVEDANDAGELHLDGVRLWPTHWMQLPSLPTEGLTR